MLTSPVKSAPAKLAFKFNAVCCAVDTGLLVSLVLSTFPSPTSVAVVFEFKVFVVVKLVPPIVRVPL